MIEAGPNAVASVLDALPLGIVALDASDCVCWPNHAVCALLARGRDELLGASASTLFPDGELRLPAEGGRPARRFELQRRRADVMPPGWSEIVCLIESAAANVARPRADVVVLGSDLGRVDAVTGVMTRKALLADLAAQVSRTRRYGNPLSVLRLGMDARDELSLTSARRLVAQSLRGCLRWVDLVGILSPEVYLVILPETRMTSARKLSDKLRAEILRQLELAGCGADVSIDFTLAEWTPGDDAASLIERAARKMRQPTSAAL